MNTRRTLAVAALVPLVVGVVNADAAVKAKPKPKPKPPPPVCKIVKDGTSDATQGPFGTSSPNDSNLDITSADIATGKTKVTGVIRVAGFDNSTGKDSSPTGRAYDVTFMIKSTQVVLKMAVGPGGTTYPQSPAGTTGVEDRAKNEVRITAPLSSLGVAIKPGDKITSIVADSWRWVAGTNAVIGRADSAGPGTYVAAWPSCVSVS